MTNVPQFQVATLHGGRVSYETIWQRQNLLLLVLPDDPPEELIRYAASLSDLAGSLLPADTTCVVTTEPVGDYETPALVIADRWGEAKVIHRGTLPTLDDVEASLHHVRMACPECEGEWK